MESTGSTEDRRGPGTFRFSSSRANDEPENALKQGALRFLTKPVNPADVEEIFSKIRQMGEAEAKKLLVIEDDENQRNSIRGLYRERNSSNNPCRHCGTMPLGAIERERFDCVVLDLLLPDMSGFELLDKIRARETHLPIIVYTAKDLSADEEERLNRIAQTTIVKDVPQPGAPLRSNCTLAASGRFRFARRQARDSPAPARSGCDPGR